MFQSSYLHPDQHQNNPNPPETANDQSTQKKVQLKSESVNPNIHAPDSLVG